MKYRGLTYNREKESYEWVYGLPSYGYATDEVAEIGTVYGDFREIFPDTLGEQTPYRDKNGKEIYTGDIVALEVDGQGEIVEATLTNTKSYPFNNSKKTLALATPRGNLDYTVNVEAEAKDAGGVGEIHITDKQLNGFKIEYTGAAKEVTVKCTVQGGYA